MAVIEEAAVAIDLRIGALAKDTRDAIEVQARMKRRAGRLLDAMHGPENLRLSL